MADTIDLDAHKRAAQFVEPPDAVLILIAEIERLREENERLESELQRQERLTIEANESLDRYIESEQELRARIRELTESEHAATLKAETYDRIARLLHLGPTDVNVANRDRVVEQVKCAAWARDQAIARANHLPGLSASYDEMRGLARKLAVNLLGTIAAPGEKRVSDAEAAAVAQEVLNAPTYNLGSAPPVPAEAGQSEAWVSELNKQIAALESRIRELTESNARLLAELGNSSARIQELQEGNDMACESPPVGCDCPGCSLARELSRA